MTKDLDFRLNHEDLLCLQLLWKWKLLSTAALHLAVYNRSSIGTTYNRLNKLERSKLITGTASKIGNSFVWHLRDQGFQLIQDSIPPLAEFGYKSENKEHDFWVTAIHLGDWLTQAPVNCALFSEQQLRRLARDQYPHWVPKANEHRPDGWWTIGANQSSERSLIALEVELSRKSPIEYRSVGEFYSTDVLPLQVIWVVRNESDINYIHRNISSGSKSDAREQSYLVLSHYLEHQWQSKIQVGKNKGISLSEILSASVVPDYVHGHSSALLDTRKKRVNSIRPNKVRFLEDGRSSSYLF